MTKQISITLQQVRVVKNTRTTEVLDRMEYVVTKMRNACVIDLGSRGPNQLREFRVGDTLSEDQAEEVARMKCFDVTITQ